MAPLSSGGQIALAFVGGFLAAILIMAVVAFSFLRSSDAYGLGHWKLNAKMPLSTMWMNLGYWTNAKGEPIHDFEEACSTLLRNILDRAGLLNQPGLKQPQRSLAVLDLGFGCGDQTFELVRLTRPERGWDAFRYVGLTLSRVQIQAARRCVARELLAEDAPDADSFQLFCADAARPATWDERTRGAVESLADERYAERWLLALDCLYHFKPSRRPVFEYAARRLKANSMAFDLVLNENASFGDKLRMRAVGVMMGCPIDTFLTEKEYLDQLVECGYDRESSTITDISEHVFSGVSGFIDDQERALSQYSVTLGGYKLAGRLFEWFGRSEVVKAVIVVARTREDADLSSS
ncbi:unnamed protein product [Clonostachys rhizophaga]|uniref:S-adenosyl-L-methionine-dependent methyltransferase n=1 Tax=Clonostachys rhizophaga TaxID=160324 RepID=A0A9N9VIB9_9HYPO|nr:unnamed protein product [Clonostachys rhizophaga]